MDKERVRIEIDGIVFEVQQGRNLLHTCISLGFDIPYFCYHPALGSVGACRQCAVKKFTGRDDKKGKIIMSCMEPVTEGLIISTTDPEARRFRAAIIESLMTNHPHDCPICDEGGECHLQDMTVMTGHTYRRFSFNKRTYRNQYLGPFIHHEMNRCIQCYRCIRFYKDYAGGSDLDVLGSANRIYFGRFTDGKLENVFSGNLVEVCPTGVFTDKPFKDHFTRKWDLTNSPSVCVHCSLGCNTTVSERYGSVRRILNRYNSEINGYFICDRGRFGNGFLNSPDRIRKKMVRLSGNGRPEEVSADIYNSAVLDAVSGKKVAGIGSPRASMESNFALECLVGTKNFYHGISDKDFMLVRTAAGILKTTPAHIASLKEIEESDALFIAGEDLTNTAPEMALSVRQASRNKSFRLAAGSGIPGWNDIPVRELAQKEKSPLYIAAPYSSELDNIAIETFRASPGDIARLGFAVAALIDGDAPMPEDPDGSLKMSAREIADALLSARNPAIITGLSCRDPYVLYCCANIALALSNKGKRPLLSIIFPESNSLGLGLMNGKPVNRLAETADTDRIDTLIVLENNLYLRDVKEKIDTLFNCTDKIIVLDHLQNETTSKAHILIPAGSFAESTGTIVNNECRAQRYYRVLPEDINVKDSWKHLSEIMELRGDEKTNKWKSIDNLFASFTESYLFFFKVLEEMPDSTLKYVESRVSRQPARYSGRTAMHSDIDVSEPEPPADNDSPLAFTMEGFHGESVTPNLIPYFWTPGWNSVQAVNKYLEEPGGSTRGGKTGVLLLKESTDALPDYFTDIPRAFKPVPGRLLIVPVHQIFGSGELSSSGQPVSGVIPDSFLLLNDNEINRYRITRYDRVKIIVDHKSMEVNLRIDTNVPDGIAGLFLRVPGIPYLDLPDWGRIESKTTFKT